MEAKKIIYIILIIIWMITVFLFSNQAGEESGGTSGKVIKQILKIFSKELTDEKVQKLQLPIRKLAHFTIYAIGGALAILLLNEFNIPLIQKMIYSQLFISIYAMSDEFHQYFIPRKNSNNNRRINRFARGPNINNINLISIIKKIM